LREQCTGSDGANAWPAIGRIRNRPLRASNTDSTAASRYAQLSRVIVYAFKISAAQSAA
jgi:hypothetical protein